jgi:hypothetical protein
LEPKGRDIFEVSLEADAPKRLAELRGEERDPEVFPDGSIVFVRDQNDSGELGFNLWRLKMFRDERLRRPWFVTRADANGVGTQDLYFWADARKYGLRCAVDCDVLVGHHDQATDTVW